MKTQPSHFYSRVRTASALLSVLLATSCLGLPRAQIVANCEIRGEIRMQGNNAPVENVMIFARYAFNKDKGKSVDPIIVGPIFSDASGRFVIPKYYRKQWYIEHLYMGDCGGDLLFVHPSLGAYSVLICTEDFPPDLPFKELAVTQQGIDAEHPTESFAARYADLDSLPSGARAMAWAHVSTETRSKK